MNVFKLEEKDLRVEFNWLYQTLSQYVEYVGTEVGGTHLSILCQPRRMGFKTLPYHLAADVYRLYEYAVGLCPATTDYIRSTIQTVLALLFYSPYDIKVGKAFKPNWKWLSKRNLGVIMLAASGRAKIIENEWLTSLEIGSLLGGTPAQIKAAGVTTKKEGRSLLYHPAETRIAMMKLEERFEESDFMPI